MISFVCFLWRGNGAYTAAHVNTLAAMVRRHYPAPHRFVCVTNTPAGIGPAITIIPDAEHFRDVPSPHGALWPSCFRRLVLFHPDAAQWFGERFVSLDLDCVITGDLRPLVDRSEDFVGWQDPLYRNQLCGSMMLLRAGSRPEVWAGFDSRRSPSVALAAGFRGSDQGWISYCLHREPRWTAADGVLSFKFDLKRGPLPPGARVVFFTGQPKPWSEEARRQAWVREWYRITACCLINDSSLPRPSSVSPCPAAPLPS